MPLALGLSPDHFVLSKSSHHQSCSAEEYLFKRRTKKEKQKPKWGIFLLPLHHDQAFFICSPPPHSSLSFLQPPPPPSLLICFLFSSPQRLAFIYIFPFFKMADNDDQVSFYFLLASIPSTDRCLPRFHGNFPLFPTPAQSSPFETPGFGSAKAVDKDEGPKAT